MIYAPLIFSCCGISFTGIVNESLANLCHMLSENMGSLWWQGMLDDLWMSPLALLFYDFVTHMLWHREQKIRGLSKEYFPMVPVTTAEFDCMTLGILPVLYCCGFLGNSFLQTVSS